MSWLTLEVSGWPLFWTLFFTAATYVNAGWMREQVCIYMCPYATLSSRPCSTTDTMIVAPTMRRAVSLGAPASAAHASPSALGDCIDCQLCVQVCPTGIDIRDGLQYQCIGCAHCVDACAQTMEQMNYSPGLIRYSTANELNGGPRRWLRARSLGYAAVTLALSIGLLTALSTRASFSFDVIRDRGQLFHDTGHGLVRNDYVLKIFNKTSDTAVLTLSVANAPGVTLSEPQRLEVPAGAAQVEALVLEGQPSDSERAGATLPLPGIRVRRRGDSFLSPGSSQGARQ